MILLVVIFFSCTKAVIQKPLDFEDFWNESLKRMSNDFIISKIIKDSIIGNKNRSLNKIKMPNNVTCTLWVSEPLEQGQFPVKVNFLDYNSNETNKANGTKGTKFLSEDGFINVVVDISKEDIKEVENIDNNFITTGLKNKDTYIFKLAVLNSVMIIDYLSSRPKSNKNIIVMGTGFGGTLAVATTGLNQKVTICSVTSPFLTDISSNNKNKWPMNIFIHYCNKNNVDYFDLMNTLSYFDVMSFASKINVPILIKAQEVDSRTPIEGVIKFYNQIKSNDKLIYIDPCEEFRCVTYSSFSRDLESIFIKNNLFN